jgi:hypothetical protein
MRRNTDEMDMSRKKNEDKMAKIMHIERALFHPLSKKRLISSSTSVESF